MAGNGLLVNFNTQNQDNQALSYVLMNSSTIVRGFVQYTPANIKSCFVLFLNFCLIMNNTMFYSYIDIEICISFC